MADRMKRLRKELQKLKDGILPLKGSGHRHAVTRNLSSVRVGPQSTLFRGQSTTLQHAGAEYSFRGRVLLFTCEPAEYSFRGPPLTTQPRFRIGGASIGASIRPEAVASSSGTSRRSKVSTEETDDWVVTGDVPGGPCDGSVILSFLGHTAYQLWNGEPRDYLTMKPAKKSLSRLHGWYVRLPENAQLQIQNTASTLFLDRSGGRISASLMNELHGGIDNIGEYSWGSGTLAFLYRQLGIASRAGCTTMAGCMTLLQAWIYEYFPCFQPSKRRGRRGVDGWPRARDWTPVSYKGPKPIHSPLQQIRTQLDAMTEQEVEWEPFGREQAAAYPRTIFSGWIMYHDFQEPYMPERVIRQLGYVQYIPRAPLTPVTQFCGKNAHKYLVDRPIAEIYNCWVRFSDSECINLSHCVPVSSTEVGQVAVDYLDWYRSHSHPFLLPESVPSTSRIPGKNCTTYVSSTLTGIPFV
ncbi:OLC1v1036004C1 [Oldenlandia corymbosa var. corymbosa]|uniref:OLC1v1036004C1 n=1 Tax=Oldenlandia corymbosa var. corymbosa TaxID=529605 RepID=A0AAV1CWV5_OLDCO|nr:OLC1v1036004C1 [Oldenlandia corymbosa var. corymbosa]